MSNLRFARPECVAVQDAAMAEAPALAKGVLAVRVASGRSRQVLCASVALLPLGRRRHPSRELSSHFAVSHFMLRFALSSVSPHARRGVRAGEGLAGTGLRIRVHEGVET